MSKLWIADSGSTKTDWCLYENGKIVLRAVTSGINPVYQTGEEINRLIKDELQSLLAPQASAPLYFYGAGVINREKAEMLQTVFGGFFTGNIEVYSDMIGAARSLCQHSPGIACILGTGSNSCFYNGNEIVNNVSPLGFILGDEGSGAVIGKLFIADLLKNQLPEKLKSDFIEAHQLTVSDIIDRVYRKPFPNRFLASFVPYIIDTMPRYGEIELLVRKSVELFFTRNVMQYDYKNYPVHFTGSVAFRLNPMLRQVAQEYGIQIGEITASPIEGLGGYHH